MKREIGEVDWQFAMSSDMEVCLDAATEYLKQGRTVAIRPSSNVDGWATLWVDPLAPIMEDPDDQR